MTAATEIHVQPAVWTDHERQYAVLLMEGEAADPSGDRDAPLVDALRAVLLARGLHVLTDPDQLPLRPVPGWHVEVSDGTVTLRWPHFTPLLAAVPLRLPDGWHEAARQTGTVLVLAGHGLGLHEHAHDGQAHASVQLAKVAADGCIVGGAVPVMGQEAAAEGLDGTLARPRSNSRHRQHSMRPSRSSHSQRWWSTRAHRHHRV